MLKEVLQIIPGFGASSPVEQVSSSVGPVGKTVQELKHLNNSPFYVKALGTAVDEIRGNFFLNRSDDITQFRFLGGTALEKFATKKLSSEALAAIKAVDKSLIDSPGIQKVVENIFDCKINQVDDAGKLVFNASKETLKTKAGRLVADSLGTTTRLGLGVSVLAEAPALYHAYENGDFGKQVVRSSAGVTASTMAFGIVAHLAKNHAPAKIKTLCAIGGAVLGSVAAFKATDSLLNKAMGKSIESQKREVRAKFKQMNEMREAAAEKIKEEQKVAA